MIALGLAGRTAAAVESQRMMGARKTFPAEALITRGPSAAIPRLGYKRPSTPAATAERMIIPVVLRVRHAIDRQNRSRLSGRSMKALSVMKLGHTTSSATP